MIVPGRFDCRGFDFNKFRAQAELISVSLRKKCSKENFYRVKIIRIK